MKVNTQRVLDQSIVKNIIFDLGGVILNLNVENTYKEFSHLSNKSVNTLKKGALLMHFFEDYERGIIDDRTFRDSLRSFLGIEVADQHIDKAWNAMLLDLPLTRLELLARLRKKHRIFLLSNTNAIHLRAFRAIVEATTPLISFESYFEKAYYSHLIGMRKPDQEIFEYVLQQNGLKASETLFLDDSVANLQGAAALGIQTIHIQDPDQLFSFFNEAYF